MPSFKMFWNDGTLQTIVGDSIVDACKKKGINKQKLTRLMSVTLDGGEEISVSGQAECDCTKRIRFEESCLHDLEKAGFGCLRELWIT